MQSLIEPLCGVCVYPCSNLLLFVFSDSPRNMTSLSLNPVHQQKCSFSMQSQGLILHTRIQCNRQTGTLLSLHSSEREERRGRVQGHSSAHQWAVAGNSSDTSTPEPCGFALSCLMWWTLLFASNPGRWIIYPFPHNLTESFSFHSSAYAGMLLHWN
jgi:hypothetical protein